MYKILVVDDDPNIRIGLSRMIQNAYPDTVITDTAENGRIAAGITVYGNRSGFTLSVSEQPPVTVLTVQISAPYGGLSRQGEQRAVDYLADRVEQLLEKTNGILQGMSGSPVIQNGKLVGAVTHVFVNEPTKGYGIFAENMQNAEE